MSSTPEIQLILGNSNKRFSGVTSTMLQVLPHQQSLVSLAVLGNSHLPPSVKSITYKELITLCKKPLKNGQSRVFHARRNDEMIQALVAKYLFKAKLKIVFTSTAQRQHSKFTRWLMAKMDGIISTCSAANSYLEKPADIIIPHGIDTNRYTPATNRADAWNNLGFTGSKGIGIFGRIRPSKGIDTFVEALLPVLKKDPQLTAIICGETTPKFQIFEDSLREKIAAANLADRFLFIGKQPFDRLPSLFRAMSCVVAASRNEGFGLTVLEAMASATPVVATEAGAWKEIVQNGENGFCVPCAAPQEMSDAIERLFTSDVERLGKQARKMIIDEYTTEQEAKRLCDYLISLA